MNKIQEAIEGIEGKIPNGLRYEAHNKRGVWLPGGPWWKKNVSTEDVEKVVKSCFGCGVPLKKVPLPSHFRFKDPAAVEEVVKSYYPGFKLNDGKFSRGRCAGGYKETKDYGRREWDGYWGWGHWCLASDDGKDYFPVFVPDDLRCNGCIVYSCSKNVSFYKEEMLNAK